MKIAVFAGSGIGGTEKAATLYALGLAKRGYSVDFLSGFGPRTRGFKQNGVRLIDTQDDEETLSEYLQDCRPDIIHQHAPGYPTENAIYRVLSASPRKHPPVIETNVFGRLEDPFSEQFIKHRMFVSFTSGTQAFRRINRPLTKRETERHTVLFNPIQLPPEVSLDRRMEVREQLGVAPFEVLALRIGQVSPKWTEWECQVHQRVRHLLPNLRTLLMEPPEQITNHIQAGKFGEGIIILPVTTDFDWLVELYASGDLMVHASDFGESFGYTLSEALSAGLPVVTRTTPWGDNAQVELIDNGANGFVCASIAEMSRRVMDIVSNHELRSQLGKSAKEKMQGFAQADTELDLLEEIILKVQGQPSGPGLNRRNEEWLEFAAELRTREWKISEPISQYPIDYAGARCYALYRKLRSRIGKFLRAIKG